MLVHFTDELVDFRDRELLRLRDLKDGESWRRCRTDCYKSLALERLEQRLVRGRAVTRGREEDLSSFVLVKACPGKDLGAETISNSCTFLPTM